MKSAIYTVNTSGALTSNAIIPVGVTIRRFGCNVANEGGGITLNGVGYYEITVSLTATATGAGDITLEVHKDGVALPGANATVAASAADVARSMSVSSVVRIPCCAQQTSVLSIVYTGTTDAALNNLAVVVTKL